MLWLFQRSGFHPPNLSNNGGVNWKSSANPYRLWNSREVRAKFSFSAIHLLNSKSSLLRLKTAKGFGLSKALGFDVDKVFEIDEIFEDFMEGRDDILTTFDGGVLNEEGFSKSESDFNFDGKNGDDSLTGFSLNLWSENADILSKVFGKELLLGNDWKFVGDSDFKICWEFWTDTGTDWKSELPFGAALIGDCRSCAADDGDNLGSVRMTSLVKGIKLFEGSVMWWSEKSFAFNSLSLIFGLIWCWSSRSL